MKWCGSALKNECPVCKSKFVEGCSDHEVWYYYCSVHNLKNCMNALLNSDVKQLSKKPNVKSVRDALRPETIYHLAGKQLRIHFSEMRKG